MRGVGPVIADFILGWENHFDLAREEDRLAKAGAEFVTARDPHYPAALREIHDPPIGLYQKVLTYVDDPSDPLASKAQGRINALLQ